MISMAPWRGTWSNRVFFCCVLCYKLKNFKKKTPARHEGGPS
jgi:hypothetical protein